jgi:hypothetical protein
MVVIRLHRWVVWWFCLGVIGGAFALVNIFLLDLTRSDEKVILFFGIMHWLLGGLVCWAWEGVTLESHAPEREADVARRMEEEGVRFDLATHQRSQRRPFVRQDPLTQYLLHYWDKPQHR